MWNEKVLPERIFGLCFFNQRTSPSIKTDYLSLKDLVTIEEQDVQWLYTAFWLHCPDGKWLPRDEGDCELTAKRKLSVKKRWKFRNSLTLRLNVQINI